MTIKPLSQIAREGAVDSLIGMEVESGGKIMGKVKNLVRDKFDRLSGIEVKPDEGSEILPVPYGNIEGVDEERKVLIARIVV